MSVAIPTGTFDILPQDPKEQWRNAHLWQFVESVIRDHAKVYGCEEIRTPMFERTELFCRSVGDATDIVSKEMYTFLDRGERSMSLRPEGTAAVMRSFIEKGLQSQSSVHRLFYLAPMFRYERPQSGRFRQHHQFGVEVIGAAQPELDAELIEMLYTLYEKLGLKNLKVLVNSLGDKTARQLFRDNLQSYLKPHLANMSDESKHRFEVNPLRILDSKDERDIEIVKGAPSILDFLTPESNAHFARVQSILSHLKIPYEINSKLVRGLDYYNNTVFEITSSHLGAQNSLAGGGRYDGLMKNLGGQDLPTIGFGAGIERMIQALLNQSHLVPERPRPALYIIPLGDEAMGPCFTLARYLRLGGTVCLIDHSGKKLKNAMQQADTLRAEYVIILGENELKMGTCELKEMASGQRMQMAIDAVPLFFKTRNIASQSHIEHGK
ncbi:MAG: histidine--tRNA ligase [Chlamydiales bacterium]|nr:histidine--tRNA ligase [Chlamydiales bacterium]